MKMRSFDWITLTLILIGALNWGLIGIFNFNLVGLLFGSFGMIVERIIYTIVGLSGLYGLTLYGRMDSDQEVRHSHS